ncbi:MAG: radical SAM protein [Candidatus Omnitrophota bacterium]|nr:radical SAM protein [Candidatus Omnitrophota bacterium]
MSDKLYFQWHITDACNFRCRHCYQDDFTKDSELGLDALIKVYNNITSGAGDKKVVISLTGGEPFLKADFFELLTYLDRQEKTEELAIITNGSLINEGLLKRLGAVRKLKQIKVSLDGATEEANDSIRRPGSFRAVVENINLLQEKTDFEIIVMLTVMRSNSYELPSLFQLCRDLKVDGLIIERFIPLGQSRGLKAEVIGKDEWMRVVKDIFEFLELWQEDNDVLPCKAFWIKFRDDGAELLGAECNLGEDSFAILPNADLLPCRRFDLKIGNLLREDFSDIVEKSDVLKDVTDKSKLKGRCGSCHLENCRGCRALAYALGKDYLAEDELCWI